MFIPIARYCQIAVWMLAIQLHGLLSALPIWPSCLPVSLASNRKEVTGLTTTWNTVQQFPLSESKQVIASSWLLLLT